MYRRPWKNAERPAFASDGPGDHPATARNVALQTRIITTGSEAIRRGTTMPAYDKLTPAEREAWKQTPEFARVSAAETGSRFGLTEDRNIVASEGSCILQILTATPCWSLPVPGLDRFYAFR